MTQYRHEMLTASLGDIAVEAFTCLLVFKNMFSFGLTWIAYDWLLDSGISKIFYIIASIQVGICLLSIPMCKKTLFLLRANMANSAYCVDVLGKRNRAFFSRHDLLRMTRLW